MVTTRHPTDEELVEAEAAYNKWRETHEQLASLKNSRVIFYHGYLTRILEGAEKDGS